MVLLSKPSTDNASRHLRRVHGIGPLAVSKAEQVQNPGQDIPMRNDSVVTQKESVLDSFLPRPVVSPFRKLLVEWIVQNQMPL
jgi:hypothetical protein